MGRIESRVTDETDNSTMPRANKSRTSRSSSRNPSPKLRYQRIVVKAGTSVLTDVAGGGGLDSAVMSDLARQISELQQGYSAEILLVTSGAIAAGHEVLGRGESAPLGRDIPSRQTLAAIGQGRLMHTYEELFQRNGVKVAQTLLTLNDLANRQSYLNVRNTLTALLELKIVPILNENDVVAVDEIGEVFGDNDRLSALVANLIDADLLVILTDIDGLHATDPHLDPSAPLIAEVDRIDETIQGTAGRHRNPWARGGMPTKLEAAQLVTAAGIAMIMCDGRAENAVQRAARGESIGTFFRPAESKLESRKRWMLSRVRDSQWGEIVVDAGAAQALLAKNVSLLPAGVKEVKGAFQRGDIVYVVEESGQQVACGIANYAAADIAQIRGLRSSRIQETLGYHYGQEVVHRNNLVLL
ncbi:MAG: glutamate 5-kinase [Dehalococcoidia bacterium]